jgi:hypothetical protein
MTKKKHNNKKSHPYIQFSMKEVAFLTLCRKDEVWS